MPTDLKILSAKPPKSQFLFPTLASNISRLVEYLRKPNIPDLAQENLELRDKALAVIINNYKEISKDQTISPTIHEDFLIKNVAWNTLLDLINFISGRNYKNEISFGNLSRLGIPPEKLIEEEKEVLKPQTLNLRNALSRFIQKNLKPLKQKKISSKFPNDFLMDMLEDLTEVQDKLQKDLNGEEKNSQ